MKNIWTNGCFDIIHLGHIKLFKYAKSLGQKLFVGIDSDNRIHQSKGYNRPINNQNQRRELLLSIRYIDDVFIFDSALELEGYIQDFNIDTMVIGDDYKNKHVIGAEFTKNLIFFPKIPDLSTSNIVCKLTNLTS